MNNRMDANKVQQRLAKYQSLRRSTQPKRFVFDSFPHGPMNVISYEEQVKHINFQNLW